MDDTIYRQAAIDALADYIHNVDKVYSTGKLSMYDCKDAATSVLGDLPSAQPAQCSDCIANGGDWECDHMHCRKGWLPSAQPERKKGKWIIRDNPGTGWYRVTCSECGEDVTSTAPAIGFLPNANVLWDYCPWCGADMRGDADD